jgi:8-oxo-dGTP pyrophosphatase MutT (NUDIX family)
VRGIFIVAQRKHGPWTIKETIQKYHNEFFVVNEDQVVRPDGEDGTYATVEVKPGVSVLPFDEDGNVYLTSQFRYAVGRDSIEASSGGMDEGETPSEAAKRELREELGIEAKELIDLGQLDVDTSIINCPARLFLARRLSFTEKNEDGTEQIKTLKIKLDEAVKKVMNGEITHAPSCALILKARIFLTR